MLFGVQIDKGMYISRKLLFAGMLLKVSGLWARGDTVKSGVVTDSTRVSCKWKRIFHFLVLQIVFRSASSQFFLFIQVSSEIWEFDPNGKHLFFVTDNLRKGTLPLSCNYDNM